MLTALLCCISTSSLSQLWKQHLAGTSMALCWEDDLAVDTYNYLPLGVEPMMRCLQDLSILLAMFGQRLHSLEVDGQTGLLNSDFAFCGLCPTFGG